MSPAATLSDLFGYAAVAWLLGMRHGVDADHLAAIDAMTRCNADARPATAWRTGLWFSVGHGTAVLAVAFAIALSTHAWPPPAWLAPFGAWASIAMLAVLGILNLLACRRSAPHEAVVFVGWRSTLYDGALRSCSPAAVMTVGALFAISFDTFSQAALMAATGMASRNVAVVGLLAGSFAAGMIVTDSLNGWWVARLTQRRGRGSARASRVMCIAVSGVSLGTAALGAGAELSSSMATWAEQHQGGVALAIVAVIGLSFLIGHLLAGKTDTAAEPLRHQAL
jgi:high-affinity nickel-transport protein